MDFLKNFFVNNKSDRAVSVVGDKLKMRVC